MTTFAEEEDVKVVLLFVCLLGAVRKKVVWLFRLSGISPENGPVKGL